MATPLKLVVIDSLGRRLVPVEKGPFAIGRGSDNQLQLPDARVSRKHAELVQDGTGGGSATAARGSAPSSTTQRSRTRELKPGDRSASGRPSCGSTTATRSRGTSATFDFRQVNALLAGLRALGSTQVLDEVLAIVLDSALELTGAERGFILLAEAGGELSQSWRARAAASR